MCDDDPKFYIESGRREPVVVPTTALSTTGTFFTVQAPTQSTTAVPPPPPPIQFSLDDTSFNTPDRCVAPFVPLNMDDASLEELLSFLKSRRVDNLG